MKSRIYSLIISISIFMIVNAEIAANGSNSPQSLSPLVTNNWLGNTSSNWSTASNWSLGHVPTSAEDVTINTGYTYYPIVSAGDVYCHNLTLGTGARLSLGSADLNIGANMNIAGQVDATNANADYMITGNVYWNAGSTANITSGEFRVEGNWYFNSGANAVLGNGTVLFTGTGNQLVVSNSAACSFYHLTNQKQSGELQFSYISTDTLKIYGNLRNAYNASITRIQSNYPVVLRGQLVNNGHIYAYGTFIFNGSVHTINLNTSDFFNNLIIKSTGNTTLGDSLRILGNLTISSGTLVAGSWPILLGGDWENAVGPAGFNEGTGKVVFNGSGNQLIYSNENFNILELQLGGRLRTFNGTSVICNQYLWTSGGLQVEGGGSFTAQNLIQEGIFGNFWLYAGGAINLFNDDIVDLNGYLYISGGTFNITGIPGDSCYWAPYLSAGIDMTNGVLDFTNVGIKLPANAKPFAENITGGTIRVAGDVLIQKAGFSPEGGTLELTGNQAIRINLLSGSEMYHCTINKAGSGTVTVTSGELVINGDLSIISGKLTGGSSDIWVYGNWHNSIGTQGFDAGTGKVRFSGNIPKFIYGAETFFNLTIDKSCPVFNGLSLNGDITVLNDLNIINGCIEMNDPAHLNIEGDLYLSAGAGLNADDLYGAHINIGKNWHNYNSGFSSTTGFSPQHSTVSFNGNSTQSLTTNALEEVFHNLIIDKPSGSFRTGYNLTILGDLQINSGTWQDNQNWLYHKISGDFSISPGAIYTTLGFANTIEFNGSANSVFTNNSPSSVFTSLLVDKTGNGMVTQVGNVTTGFFGNLTILQGKYNVNGQTLSVDGNIVINNTGWLLMAQPSSTLLMTKAQAIIDINQGGRLEATGTSGNPCTISKGTAGSYQLNVNSGGTISARNVVFSGLNINGIQINNGGTVDPLNPFRGCSFLAASPNGALLTLNNNQDLTIENAVFPSNVSGASFNVRKTINSGTLNFIGFSGPFAGEAYENDPFNRISWIVPLTAMATATPASICLEGSSQLNCSVSGGVPQYTYFWSPSTGLSSTNISNPVATPLNSTQYGVTVTDSWGNMASSSVSVSVSPNLPVSVAVQASGNPVCEGSTVTFTATPVNGGTAPVYQWRKGGVNIPGATSAIYSYIPESWDAISCQLTSNLAGCVTGNPANSNTIDMNVVPNVTLYVSIDAVPGDNVCPGTMVTYNVYAVNAGVMPLYQWKKGGVDITGATSSTYNYTPLNGDVISCLVTRTEPGCIVGNPALSNALAMTVNPGQPVSVSISASGNNVCSGTTVSYTATASNGGTVPAYQWKRNGFNGTGATSENWSYKPINGDTITCQLTSNLPGCLSGNPAISNAIVMAVTQAQAVQGNVFTPEHAVEPGTLVTYTVIPVNGGATPQFLWKVNEWYYDSTSSTFSYIPSDGDVITCRITSSLSCVVNNPVWTYPVYMAVVEVNSAAVGNIPWGAEECYNAFNTITVGGTGTPFTIQNYGKAFMIAGQKIRYLPGTKVLSGGYMHGYIDDYYCGNYPPWLKDAELTATKEPMAEPAQTSLFTIFPNPAREKFTLMYKGDPTEEPIIVEIIDIQGTTILKDQITGERSKQFRMIDYPSGIYLVKINVNNRYESLKLILY